MKLMLLSLTLMLLNHSFAKSNHITHKLSSLKAGCAGATALRDLDINNVRAAILNGGDMWWNLNNARYEVPKVQGGQLSKNSLSTGALWFGGITNGNLRLACQTYRQQGSDFYPGPLTIAGASITQEECTRYDQMWKVTLAEVNSFKKSPAQWASPPADFASWPAMGNTADGQAKYLAPFVDANGNGEYEPGAGDYPSFLSNTSVNIPDMMIYWIYNDKGNIHNETQGMPIGLECQSFAFAYATSDHLNNSTFYKTIFINRGNETIDNFIVSQWTDGGIGNDNDDFVQFDLSQKMMITYNGDADDEGILGYGINPPSIGIVLLEGPSSNGSDLPLSNFMTYQNDYTAYGNPSRPEHYWSYMNSRWKDGSHLTYGSAGFGGTDTATFMYPGLTDNAGRREWTEDTEQNTPGDRRMLVSYAPFSLLPGAVNTISYAAVWARATSGGAKGSFTLLNDACNQAKTFYQQFIRTGTAETKARIDQIQLYPNPGTTELHLSGKLDPNSEISFFDLKGTLVLKTKIQSSVSLLQLESGMYFYKIEDAQHTVIQTGKWLKK